MRSAGLPGRDRRPDEALRLVEDYLAADPEEAADRANRRFARQLHLWIDASGSSWSGRLHGSAAGPFRPVLTAAACYQERPVVRAQLLWSTDPTARSLAVAAPSTVPQPPAF